MIYPSQGRKGKGKDQNLMIKSVRGNKMLRLFGLLGASRFRCLPRSPLENSKVGRHSLAAYKCRICFSYLQGHDYTVLVFRTMGMTYTLCALKEEPLYRFM